MLSPDKARLRRQADACQRNWAQYGKMQAIVASYFWTVPEQGAESARLRVADNRSNRLEDAIGLKGLDNKILCAGGNRVNDHRFLTHCRAHHNIRRRVCGADCLQRFQAIHIGHGNIHNHQVRLDFIVLVNRIRAVNCFVQVGITVFAQGILDDLSHKRRIVNTQNFSHCFLSSL